VFASDPGDYIGGGLSKVFQSPTETITVGSRLDGRLYFDVDDFSGDFVGPSGMNPITIGYYGGLQRWPFHDPLKGGFSVLGPGRGCNTLSGWFAVDKISFSGTTITSLDLRFEQHCDGTVPALRAAIHWSR
jgi:hypothetical protein